MTKKLGEFEIYEAEPAKSWTVSDVAGFGVIMANAVLSLKIREEGVRLGSRNVRSRLAAVGGNKVVFLRKMLKKSRDIGASTLLQSL